MTEETDKEILYLKNVKKKLTLFFPEDAYSYTDQAVENGLESGDFLAKPLAILPFVQTALLDDKVLEVETDGMSRTYFSRLYDDIPDLEEVAEDENGEPIFQEPEYSAGDYLKLLSHLICLPVEPGMGNLQIRNSQRITLRLFTSTTAIELGTFFQDLATVRGLPVLRLAFPVIGRQVRGTRAFRAKVTLTMNFTLFIKGKEQRPDIQTTPIDISANGMSFEIKKEEMSLFKENDICSIQFIMNGQPLAKVNGTVRHLSKIRAKKGIQYNCGVQFDLPTRALATTIETMVATVQRAHLQELSEKSEESGISLVK
jgi:c-di-GMP-binding flagellar brake protein YcgR